MYTGLRPKIRDNALVLNPLLPSNRWSYFCLDRVRYHNRWITIIWDKTGLRYNMGIGLRVSDNEIFFNLILIIIINIENEK